jgi:hypothetical protein
VIEFSDTTGANLGTGKDRSIREIMNCEEETTGVPIPLVYRPRRQEDPASLVADPSFAQNGLGWTAQHTAIEVAISTAWKWMNRPICPALSSVTDPGALTTGLGELPGITAPPTSPSARATRMQASFGIRAERQTKHCHFL